MSKPTRARGTPAEMVSRAAPARETGGLDNTDLDNSHQDDIHLDNSHLDNSHRDNSHPDDSTPDDSGQDDSGQDDRALSPADRRSLLTRWGRFVARHCRVVLALWIPLAIACAVAYPMLQSRLATPDFSVSGSESARAQELVARSFPALGTEQDAIVFRSRTLVADDPAYRAAVEAALAGVRGRPGVAAVTGPYDPLAVGQIAADRHVSVALIGMSGDASERARLADSLQDEVAGRVRGSPVEAYLTGASPLNNDLATVELSDQTLAESIGIPVALAVLLLALGGLVAAALPVVLALASVGLCMGIFALLVAPLQLDQFVTVIATMVGIGVGIDYALFVVSRFREELARTRMPGTTRAPQDATVNAVGVALHTSGRTVIASGFIVIVALGSMAVMDGHVFHEIAIAAGVVVACTVAASMTLLPALLALLGDRVNALGLPRRLRPPDPHDAGRTSWSARWARTVLRRPIRMGVPALLVLVLAALPLASMRLGLDLGLTALRDTPSGRGQEIVAASFGAGAVGPLQVVACDRAAPLDSADLAGVAALASSMRADPRVAQVVAPTDVLDFLARGHGSAELAAVAARPELRRALSQTIDLDKGGRCALVQAVLAVPVDLPAAADLVADVRGSLAPRAFAGTGVHPLVTGLTAQYVDVSDEATGKLPLVIAIVLAISFLYLMVVVRSLLLPAKAVVLNLLATGAALGLTVFVFQEGHGEGLLDFTSVGTLQAYLPVALFTLLFGLSMDYEVFLVRRIQEEYLRSGDNTESVATAIAHTARQITAAAVIMVAVFGSFVVASVLELKQFGFALSVAVLLDATIIRLLLVPAFMALASRRNWWLPTLLERRLPRLSVE